MRAFCDEIIPNPFAVNEGDPVRIGGRLVGHIVRVHGDRISDDGNSAVVTIDVPIQTTSAGED